LETKDAIIPVATGSVWEQRRGVVLPFTHLLCHVHYSTPSLARRRCERQLPSLDNSASSARPRSVLTHTSDSCGSYDSLIGWLLNTVEQEECHSYV
jgi:hypothetical protein